MIAAKKPSGKFNTEMFDDVPVLRRKWQAALRPGERLPRYEDVMLGSLGFPFDKIKIDRSFVKDLAERPDCVAIVRAISGLGRSLNITTTAEGVETEDQLAWLRAEGCDEVQGFLFSAAKPAAEIETLLSRFGARASRAA